MDNDFMQYVYSRIDKALMGDEKYKELRSECNKAYRRKNTDLYDELLSQVEATEQELCYIQGFKDAMALSRCS